MYARPAHARKFACTDENLHVWMKIARVEMFSGGSEITTLSQEYKRACYRNKFELGGEPGSRRQALNSLNCGCEAERQCRQR